ncbi:hypothetical protein WNZ14_22255 [Hoeflea sp. AS60]|uniref:hypothetical protein n=1 Tax=Hoeflea sp. AS60 TaxID=3135780 RepID=UPI003179E97B
MLVRIGLFIVITSTAYSVLAILFGVYCLIGGHNIMEALYGEFTTYLLAFVVGTGGVWVLADSQQLNPKRD